MEAQDMAEVVPLFGESRQPKRDTQQPSTAWQWRDVLPPADYERLLQLLFSPGVVEDEAA